MASTRNNFMSHSLTMSQLHLKSTGSIIQLYVAWHNFYYISRYDKAIKVICGKYKL